MATRREHRRHYKEASAGWSSKLQRCRASVRSRQVVFECLQLVGISISIRCIIPGSKQQWVLVEGSAAYLPQHNRDQLGVSAATWTYACRRVPADRLAADLPGGGCRAFICMALSGTGRDVGRMHMRRCRSDQMRFPRGGSGYDTYL